MRIDQLFHLRVLRAFIAFAKSHVHAFVAKVLATLKLALDGFSHNDTVFAEALLVCSTFLHTLGSDRISRHLKSILTPAPEHHVAEQVRTTTRRTEWSDCASE